jgi:hypothetical protein
MRLCELHLVMDEINNYYSEWNGDDSYGLHILI